jgi:hypothetical protein
MVKTPLVEQDIVEGRRFLEALKQPAVVTIGRRRVIDLPAKHFRVKAAFWLYWPESDEWRLVIATPLVDEQGPQATYRDIRAVLAANLASNLSLQNISAVSPKDPLVKAFQNAMKIVSDREGTRLTRNTLNGTYVEDAYVYKLQ